MYFFYIDESGSRDPTVRKTGKNADDDHLYVLTAVSLFEMRWARFDQQISQVKLDLINRLYRDQNLKFDLADCEVKSTWLRIPQLRERFSPFLTEIVHQERVHLAETFYQQLVDHYMRVFSVVIDKRKLRNHVDHLKLHKKAYELLLERIESFLAEFHPKHRGVIVMDDTDKTINRSLSMKHAWFQREGNQNLKFTHIVEYPFFTDSKLSNGVQMADLCGYNIYRAFRSEKFDYPYFQRMLPHIYRSRRTADDKLDGLKVWPDDSELIEFAQKGWCDAQTKQPGNEPG